jgi:hypothetical protein
MLDLRGAALVSVEWPSAEMRPESMFNLWCRAQAARFRVAAASLIFHD